MVKSRNSYGWTGWVKEAAFPEFPNASALIKAWEKEGIHLKSFRLRGQQIQLLVKTQPHLAPQFIAQRLKGRLQHALRSAGTLSILKVHSLFAVWAKTTRGLFNSTLMNK